MHSISSKLLLLIIIIITPVYAALSSDRERTFARASSAIFIVCYTLSLLGYFTGLKKSILVPRQCVPYLGISIDSVRQAFTLLEEKRLKFIALAEFILSSKTVDVKTLQHFTGKCISFSYAVPGTCLFANEVNLAISKGLHSSRPPRVASPLLEEIQHWTFLRSWHRCLPWLMEFHAQIQLASDASSFAWGGVLGAYTEPVSTHDYWPPLGFRAQYSCERNSSLGERFRGLNPLCAGSSCLHPY